MLKTSHTIAHFKKNTYVCTVIKKTPFMKTFQLVYATKDNILVRTSILEKTVSVAFKKAYLYLHDIDCTFVSLTDMSYEQKDYL